MADYDSQDNEKSDEATTSGDESKEEDTQLHLVALATCEAAEYVKTYLIKEPIRTSSFTGHHFITDVLEGHDIRCHQMFRVEKYVFRMLCETLHTNYGLVGTRNMSIEEMFGIFLMTIRHKEVNRSMQERFQHSGETISRHFHSVLKAVCKMSMDWIRPSENIFTELHDHIQYDKRYMPYFRDCVGAIDGTHIPCVVSPNENVPYIGRKGITTQNVMASCDWDMCFIFAWAGWEGSAHDTRVFSGALSRTELNFPPSNRKILPC